jgi:hypothetical protein
MTVLVLVAAMVAYIAAPIGPTERTAVEGLAALFAASAIVWGVRSYRPPRTEAWRSFAAGWALWGLGRLLNVMLPSMGAGTSAEVTLVDVPLLGGALFLVAGLFWLVAGDGHSGRKESAIDAGVITLAATLALWMLVIVEIVHDPTLSGIDRIVGLAYPLTSLALLGTVVTLALAPRRRTAALWLVMAGIGAFLVSEVASLAAIVGPALDGAPVQAAALAGPLLVGAAALRRDLGVVGAPAEETEVGLSEGRLIALWLAALCSPMAFLALATAGNADREHLATDLVLAAGVTAVMLSLVLWRLAGTVSHLGTTLVERDAASERELAVADIAARLARAERIQEVRDIVRSSGALLEADDASVDLWLPEDRRADGSGSLLEHDDEGELAPYLLRHPLFTDPAEGVLVIRSFEPIPSGVRSALSLVAGEVGLALDRARLATELRRSERASAPWCSTPRTRSPCSTATAASPTPVPPWVGSSGWPRAC